MPSNVNPIKRNILSVVRCPAQGGACVPVEVCTGYQNDKGSLQRCPYYQSHKDNQLKCHYDQTNPVRVLGPNHTMDDARPNARVWTTKDPIFPLRMAARPALGYEWQKSNNLIRKFKDQDDG